MPYIQHFGILLCLDSTMYGSGYRCAAQHTRRAGVPAGPTGEALNNLVPSPVFWE